MIETRGRSLDFALHGPSLPQSACVFRLSVSRIQPNLSQTLASVTMATANAGADVVLIDPETKREHVLQPKHN